MPRSSGRRALLPLVAVLMSAALVASGCSVGSDLGPPRAEPPPAGATTASGAGTGTGDEDDITSADFEAVGAVLDRRARALRAGNRRAFLATVDRGNRRLRRTQEAFFDNVQLLPVDRLYYSLGEGGLTPGKVRGRDPVLRPIAFEHLRLDGILGRPVTNQVSITFVERDGRWLVGAENVDTTFTAQARPWYGARIDVARDDDLLVITDQDADISAESLLVSTRVALEVATDVLDESPDRPLLVDATTNGLATELSNASGENAGAISYQVFSYDDTGRGFRGVAGSVVKANPENVAQLVEDGRTLRHELTHFLLDGYGDTNPQWVTEGIAEYVGYYPSLLARSVASDPALLDAIAERDVELTPPGLWGNEPDLDYLTAQAFAEHLISTYGLDRYREMMDLFKRRSRHRGTTYGEGLVDRVLRQVYGIGARDVARAGFDLLEGLAD